MWDTCAGDAIIQAMGGIFTDQNGKPIDYNPQEKGHVNKTGNICTFSQQLHKKVIEAYDKILHK